MEKITNNDIIPIIKDLLAGDPKVEKLPGFNDSLKVILQTFSKLINDPKLPDTKKLDYLNNSWKLIYRQRPPLSMEEYLTFEWVGPVAGKLFDFLRDDLINFFNPTKPYRHLYLASAIGTGKSTGSALIALFIIIHLSLMRNPKAFFNVAATTSFVTVLGSFTLSKAKQLLKQPFDLLIRSNPKFRRVIRAERIDVAQEEEYEKGTNRIVYTTASRIDGDYEFYNDVHILRVSDVSTLLGMNIICGILSEISFFLERGVSPQQINQFRTDLQSRVWSRFENNYFARTIIDSSPNTMESPIDKFIFSGEAAKDPRNLVINRPYWECLPEKNEIWLKTGKTFPVFRGDGGTLPKVIEEDEVENFAPQEIYRVPIDLRGKFTPDQIAKSVKDYCAYPTTNDSKLIQEFSLIEKMFSEQLINIYDYIYAPDYEKPEELIWNKIKDKFFIKTRTKGEDKYDFYRFPGAPRYFHIDQSKKKDSTGISMVHPEYDIQKNRLVIITDFTLVINSTFDSEINLDAIVCFIDDLKQKGGINIKKVTFDGYQSAPGIQRLKRYGIPVEHFSVDDNTDIYYTYISFLKQKRIKAGRNIYLKNNLKSLRKEMSDSGKLKIDHIKGDLVKKRLPETTWETDLQGINAKDCSDSHCGAVYHCIQDNISETTEWNWIDDESYKKLNSGDKSIDFIKATDSMLKDYGLIPVKEMPLKIK